MTNVGLLVAHLDGKVAAALMEQAPELFSEAPKIEWSMCSPTSSPAERRPA